jgi:hypothetical protein
MHEKMLMLLVFLYIMASFCTKKFILSTARLFIKIGLRSLSFARGSWSIGLLPVLIISAHLPASSGTFPLSLCTPHAFDPLPEKAADPSADGRSARAPGRKAAEESVG